MTPDKLYFESDPRDPYIDIAHLPQSPDVEGEHGEDDKPVSYYENNPDTGE